MLSFPMPKQQQSKWILLSPNFKLIIAIWKDELQDWKVCDQVVYLCNIYFQSESISSHRAVGTVLM